MQNGSCVLGPFSLLSRLGEGGMGNVWLGTTDSGVVPSDKPVAVKVTALDHRPIYGICAKNEWEIGRRFRHPGLPRYLEMWEGPKEICVAMEKIDGVDLYTLLKSFGRLHPLLSVEILIKVCEALAYLHELTDEHGEPLCAVHCDVKPENILLTPRGEVILMDFGIVHYLGMHPYTHNSAFGTACYVSPEQACAVALDHRSDLFTVGSLLYELLLRRRAFYDGRGEQETMRKAVSCMEEKGRLRRYRPLRKWPRLSGLVEFCHQYYPEGRPQSAWELCGILRTLLAELPCDSQESFPAWAAQVVPTLMGTCPL